MNSEYFINPPLYSAGWAYAVILAWINELLDTYTCTVCEYMEGLSVREVVSCVQLNGMGKH